MKKKIKKFVDGLFVDEVRAMRPIVKMNRKQRRAQAAIARKRGKR